MDPATGKNEVGRLEREAAVAAAQAKLAGGTNEALHKEGEAPSEDTKPVATVLRFDLHQRLQHGLLATSFVLLTLTGWPLAAHHVEASSALVRFFGGIEMTSLLHRIAAVILIVASVYHVIYLTALAARRKLRPSMAPTPTDVKNLVQNLQHFLGRAEKPKFPRFTYFEKFDYWAVFWGVVVMVGSGFVRWFPVESSTYLPAWTYEIAHYAHADEALLAVLAIFIWHFYNVHLRPGIFPMSRVFLNGKLTLHQFEDEHGAEYEEWKKAEEAKAKKAQAERAGKSGEEPR